MASYLWCALRKSLSRRQSTVQLAKRRTFRLRVEALEARLLMDAAPHGGVGTLADEHAAVMRLVDFDEIHRTAANPVYYVARDGAADATTPNLWSDVQNWLKQTYDPATDSFVETVAEHLPTTGDDVEIPHGLTFTYDLRPTDFQTPTLPGMDANGRAEDLFGDGQAGR